jgi:hypothetical protein
MAKLLKSLIEDYRLNKGDEDSFFELIVDTMVGGEGLKVVILFNEMKRDAKLEFLNRYLEVTIKDNPYSRVVRMLCVEELCNYK